MRSCWSVIPVVLCITSSSRYPAGAQQPLPEKRVVEVLRMLAAQNQANYERLETWEGAYTFTDRLPWSVPAPAGGAEAALGASRTEREMIEVILVRAGVVRFALDVAAGRLFVDFDEDDEAVQVFAKSSGEPVELDYYQGRSQRALVTPGDVITMPSELEFGPIDEHPDDPHHIQRTGGRLAQRTHIPRHLEVNDANEIIDPRRFFTLAVDPIWKQLTLYADALEGRRTEEEQKRMRQNLSLNEEVSDDGRIYLLTVEYLTGRPEDDQAKPKQVARFGEKVEFLPTEQTLHARSGHVNEYRRWEYEKIGGVLIPRVFHYTFNRLDDGSLILDRELVHQESKLNEPLAEAAFSLEGFQFRRGDRLVDRVEKQLYVHNGESLADASEYESPQPASRSATLLFWSSVHLVLLLLVVGSIVAWRRFRRRFSR